MRRRFASVGHHKLRVLAFTFAARFLHLSPDRMGLCFLRLFNHACVRTLAAVVFTNQNMRAVDRHPTHKLCFLMRLQTGCLEWLTRRSCFELRSALERCPCFRSPLFRRRRSCLFWRVCGPALACGLFVPRALLLRLFQSAEVSPLVISTVCSGSMKNGSALPVSIRMDVNS